jgi:hypothetical protein
MEVKVSVISDENQDNKLIDEEDDFADEALCSYCRDNLLNYLECFETPIGIICSTCFNYRLIKN